MTRDELTAVVQATGCAEECGGSVFLCDPNLSRGERLEVDRIKSALGTRRSAIADGWLCIRTGGTSGGMKFARHDERTLAAAVRGFCAHFGIERVNAVDVLPAFHVSGLMARARCAATGGEHVAWEWKKLEAGDPPLLQFRRGGDWVVSLVPTQLQRLLAKPEAVAWLRRFRAIFLGGGPVWPELADAAARAELRVSLSYGLTETAAMVAALRPEEFLAGARSCGAALPHARVSVNADGVICVSGKSVCRGLIGREPAGFAPGNLIGYRVADGDEKRDEAGNLIGYRADEGRGVGQGGNLIGYPGGEGAGWVTEDLGRLDERGHLWVLGRRDEVIITGGKKVHPAEVEAALRASGEFAEVAVIGVPDAEWGEVVVAAYVRGEREPDPTKAVRGLAAHLRPKRFEAVAADAWPRNAQGKVNRAELAKRAGAA